MKVKYSLIILSVFVTAAAGNACFAQTPYPEVSFSEYSTPVKVSGKTVTIVDFVNSYLANPEDELNGALAEMWKRHRSSKKQKDKGDEVTVDVKNGYVRFFDVDEYDSKSHSVTEMCYWNCSDGKHAIVAYNHYFFVDGKVWDGQYSGLSLSLYSKEKRLFTGINYEDLGLEVHFEEEPLSSGYDGKKDFFVEYSNGKKVLMNKEEYFNWLDKRPLRVWILPRQGTQPILRLYSEDKVLREKRFAWDGVHFKEVNDYGNKDDRDK